MSDHRKSLALLLLLTLVAAVRVVQGVEGAHGPLATHFGGGGQADGGAMSATGFRWFAAGMWLVIVASFWTTRPLLRRLDPRWMNLPHKERWLGQPRELLAGVVGGWLESMGLLTLAFLAVVHELIFRANESNPPQLDQRVFLGLLALYFALLIAWMVGFFRRMDRPGP